MRGGLTPLWIVLVIVGCNRADFMTRVDYGPRAYYIDTYETSTSWGKAISFPGAIPVNQIDYQEAKETCRSMGKRLCSVVEWIVACIGPTAQLFAFQQSDEDPQPISKVCDVGRIPTAGKNDDNPTETGSRERCKTAGLRVYDIIGNVSEWTEEGYTMGSPYNPEDIKKADCIHHLVERETNGRALSDKASNIGVRCCADHWENELPPAFP